MKIINVIFSSNNYSYIWINHHSSINPSCREIYNLRFAVDIILISSGNDELQQLTNSIS